jgi:hypothetical protein
MANINAHLPSSIAVAFHPPTENLQHENLVRPVIPKPEIISSYTKLHEDREPTHLSSQSRNIIQEDEKYKNKDEYQGSSSERRRHDFFMARKGVVSTEKEISNTSSNVKHNVRDVISVIQARYNNAVHPFPDPSVSFAI